jgi:hypothetical protein
VSYSVSELSGECLGGIFLPSGPTEKALRQGPPKEWSTVEQEPGAALVDLDPVEVSIQGESERTITLTGIDFKVARHDRPRGAVFRQPCGGPIPGRALKVDLDVTPPRVVDSNADENGLIGSTENGHRLTQPIRFPWTVSLTDPLLLYVMATTESCYCVWSAEIPWVSGAQRGAIKIDNGGDGYSVAYSSGVPTYDSFENRWNRSPSGL